MKQVSMLAGMLCAAGVLGLATDWANADPTLQFHITGSYSPVIRGAAETKLESTSLTYAHLTQGGNGSLDISPEGPFDIIQFEFSALAIENVGKFGYFGLVNSYDDSSALISSLVYVAGESSVDGALLTNVFEPFLTTHPSIASYSDLVTLLVQGPNFPTDGANTTWIDFNSFVLDGGIGGQLDGEIMTPTKTGETLTLYAFDPSTGVASAFGTIANEAQSIPEPSTLGLASVGMLGLMHRRRR